MVMGTDATRVPFCLHLARMKEETNSTRWARISFVATLIALTSYARIRPLTLNRELVMRNHTWFAFAMVLLFAAVALAGCVRAARDTQGFPITDTASLNAPFEATWQAAKAVLRERELDLYTRDKRGVFVAYSPMKRHRFLVSKRVQYTLTLRSVSDDETQITIETVRQVYGVTLLTYPGWHDRKTTDHEEALALLDAIKAKVGSV